MMIKLTKILYPTDFSELSLVALKYAKSFAEQFQAQLHVLNVLDEAYQYWLTMGPEGLPMGPDINQMLDISRKQMKDFVAENFNDRHRTIATVISGKPFIEIIRYARDEKIDMIIMATHGRSGLKSVMLGSVADRVVRKAPCPVLTIRSDTHDFVLP
jgi:nucleotide-binding universal stress UspA family protein